MRGFRQGGISQRRNEGGRRYQRYRLFPAWHHRFADEVRPFWSSANELLAPTLWEAELGNVVWMAVRAGVLPAAEAPARLTLAGRLGIHSIPSRRLWHGALLRAIHSGTAVYDTLFVELADREGVPLVTFDAKLIRAWPKLCIRPRDL